MVAPLVGAMVIGGLVSGGLQYMNSRDAQKQSAQEQARMRQMIDRIQDPDFDFSQITPEEYKVLEKFNPQIAPYIAEKNPQLLRGESRGRDAEERALEQMLNLSRSGQDPLADIERNKMSRQASGDANSSRASLDQLFQRRGAAPTSMMAYGSNLSAIQDAGMREALAGEQAAQHSIGRRDDATRNAASLGGQIRNADMNMEQYNVGAINDFNNRMAGNLNDHNRYAANEMNKGNLFNIENAQNTANQNVAQRNNAQFKQQDNNNRLKQQQFSNDLSRTGMASQNSAQGVNTMMQGTAQENQAIQGLFNTGVAAAMYGSDPTKKEGGLIMPLSPYYKPVELDDPNNPDEQFGLDLQVEPPPAIMDFQMNQPQAETPIRGNDNKVDQGMMLDYMKKRYPDELANQSYEYEQNRVTADELSAERDAASQRTLLAAIAKGTAQIGNLGGKASDSSSVSEMAGDMNKQGQNYFDSRNKMALQNKSLMEHSIGKIGELESKDPNSDYSKFARQFAKENLGYEAPPNVNAEQLNKFMPMISSIYKSQMAATATRAAKEEDRTFQEKQTDKKIAANKELLGMKTGAAKEVASSKATGKDPSLLPPAQRLNTLGATDRGNLDKMMGAVAGIRGMRKALEAGSSTFSIVGDNDFTKSERAFAENLGRLQSGGAISTDELDTFKSFAPKTTDTPEMRQKKLQDAEAMILDRIYRMGFKEEELAEIAPNQLGGAKKPSPVATPSPDIPVWEPPK